MSEVQIAYDFINSSHPLTILKNPNQKMRPGIGHWTWVLGDRRLTNTPLPLAYADRIGWTIDLRRRKDVLLGMLDGDSEGAVIAWPSKRGTSLRELRQSTKDVIYLCMPGQLPIPIKIDSVRKIRDLGDKFVVAREIMSLWLRAEAIGLNQQTEDRIQELLPKVGWSESDLDQIPLADDFAWRVVAMADT